MIDISVILTTCFLCFSVSAIICKNSDYADTCTSIFFVPRMDILFILFCMHIIGGD